jgi:uncharacterized protein (TIGR03435 family)
MQADDMDLVRTFAASGSDAAFAELVRRHINLVYSVALRRLQNPHDAEEVAQAVFVILARKAPGLRSGTILSGWLYQTAQLTSSNFQRAAIRRHHREQEAFMQFTQESEPDTSWQRLSPLLEEAMMRLRQPERDAIVLRFFQNRTVREVAAALGLEEAAAQKRLSRATEKLRLFFVKRGVQVSASTLLASIGTQAVQAAPVGVASRIAATAAAKSAVSASTSILIKSTLKLMAWTKAKTAIITGTVILFAAGTATVAIDKYESTGAVNVSETGDYNWQVAALTRDNKTLEGMPPLVDIVPTKFPGGGGARIGGRGHRKYAGLNRPAADIVRMAYGYVEPVNKPARMVIETDLPSGNYDFISSVPSHAAEALQQKIKEKFGVVAKREIRQVDVFLMQVGRQNAPGLIPSGLSPNAGGSQKDTGRTRSWTNASADELASFLEGCLNIPVINQTALKRGYKVDLDWSGFGQHPDPDRLKQLVLDQLGLELVPTNMPVEMLVVGPAEN